MSRLSVARCVSLVAMWLLVASLRLPISAQPEADAESPLPPPKRETIYDLPLADEVPLPDARELLNEAPIDWIYIEADNRGDRLLETEPLDLRPNLLQKVEQRVDAAQKALEDALPNGGEKVDELRAAVNAARLIELHLVGDRFGFAYSLDTREIKRIEHHEDKCLRRAAQLREAGRIDEAWELLIHVRRRDENWPGLDRAINEVMFADAARLLAADQPERAMAVMDQLFERDPRFLNLETRYAEAVDRLVDAAVQQDDYRRARYDLSRLQATFPQSRSVGTISQKLERIALGVLDQAQSLAGSDPRQAAELARRAGKIWPPLGGRKRVFEQLTRDYPILHVGVLDVAEPASSPLLAGPANWRFGRLTSPRLFHQRAVDADLVRYGSDFVEDWQPEDLGRRVTLRLLGRQPRMQAQPITSSYALAGDLLAAADDTARYGDRYAATLLGVQPVRGDRLELRLGVQPLRVQAFLSTVPLAGPGPFQSAPVTADTLPARQASQLVRFVRTHRPDDIPGAIAEIVEHRFADGDAMVRALRRAEVDMLSDVPLFTAVRLLADDSTRDQAIAGPCSLPETHILQFRPGGTLAATTELRRGLAVAMDRDSVLRDVFLHDRSTPLARLTTSMMPQFSYASDPTTQLRTPDRFAATALGLVGRRKIAEDAWGGWKMLTPSDDRSRQAAAQLIEQFRRAGYPVELVAPEDRDAAIAADDWEILYRRVQIAEPLVQLWPTLALGQDARIGELTHLPETLRRRLLDLENVDDWTEATDLLRAIDRSIWASAIVIPLWELDRVTLRRRSLRDAPEPPLWPYDRVGDWRLEPQIEKTVD